MFGEALNLAVHGDREQPLPLHADSQVEAFFEVEVKLLSGANLVAMDITNTSDPYCRVYVKGDALYRKREKSSVRFSTLSPQWQESLKIWPVEMAAAQREKGLTLVVEVWDHDTTSGDDFMGRVEVPFEELRVNGTTECYSRPLRPKEEERKKRRRQRRQSRKEKKEKKERDLRASGDDTDEGNDYENANENDDDDDDGDGGGGGRNEGVALELLAGHIGTISFEVTLNEKTVLTAAEDFGIPRHAFQSCLCMLSEPGGLFLDVKSTYSKAKHLAQFCTTLAGLGICVKSVCSFSPSQLRLPPAEGGLPSRVQTVRFFHGLSGLENACDNGHIRRHACVFFNGASFLVDPTKSESEGGALAKARLGSLDTMYATHTRMLVPSSHSSPLHTRLSLSLAPHSIYDVHLQANDRRNHQMMKKMQKKPDKRTSLPFASLPSVI